MVPTRDHTIAEPSKNHRYSTTPGDRRRQQPLPGIVITTGELKPPHEGPVRVCDMSVVTDPSPAHTLRPATRADLPAVLDLLADENQVVDPETIVMTEAHERAFVAIDTDPRNDMLVLVDGSGTVVGCLQATYIPGLGKGGAERALVEAVRIRAGLRTSTADQQQTTRGRTPLLHHTRLHTHPRRIQTRALEVVSLGV